MQISINIIQIAVMVVISVALFYIMLRLINSRLGSSLGLPKLRDLLTMKFHDHIAFKIIIFLPAMILTFLTFDIVDNSIVLEIIAGVLIGLTAAFTYDKTKENHEK
jgi:uncharacterized membrane protein